MSMRVKSRRSKVMLGSVSVLLVAAMLSFGLALVSSQALAASVAPTYMAGNPRCTDLNASWTEVKFDPPRSGTIKGVTMTTKDGIFADWTSTVPVAAVIVKCGPIANIYTYGGSTGDTRLVSPTNPKNGKPYALSHVSFCFGGTPAPTPTPTPEPTPPPVCYDQYSGEAIPCQ